MATAPGIDRPASPPQPAHATGLQVPVSLPSEAASIPGETHRDHRMGSSHAVQSAWDGLPAPWEPLPDWLQAPPPVKHTGAVTVQPALPDAAPAPVPVQRAEEGWSPGAGTDVAEVGPSRIDQAAVEPDLDALARRVYTVLKRRLDVERRRLG